MPDYEVRRVAGEAPLSDAFAVRRAVFIDEQDVSEDVEMDGKDEAAIHFVAYDTGRGEPVGTARLRFPGEEAAKAERVAVLERYRGEGLGRRLMRRAESEASKHGCSRMKVNAQTRVEGFYSDLGYETVSGVFYEADIPHVEMVKDLD
ncbi:MAG: GNAT family N-acetyltransferase [Haloarculaceae archaeon]